MRMDGDRCVQGLRAESISISSWMYEHIFPEMNYKHCTKDVDILYISYSDSYGYITYT